MRTSCTPNRSNYVSKMGKIRNTPVFRIPFTILIPCEIPYHHIKHKGAVSKFDQRLFCIRMERVLSEWFRW